VIHHVAAQERGALAGLVADHARSGARSTARIGAVSSAVGAGVRQFPFAVTGTFAVADPVGGDVARIAYGDAVVVRGAAQFLHDFKCRTFLALQAIRIDRVDDGHGQVVGQFPDQAHAVV